MRFGLLQAVKVLTESQMRSLLHLLQRDDLALSKSSRVFRDHVLAYLRKEADFISVFAEMLQIDQTGKKTEPDGHRPGSFKVLPSEARKTKPPKALLGKAGRGLKRAKEIIISLPPLKALILGMAVGSIPMITALSILYAPEQNAGRRLSFAARTAGPLQDDGVPRVFDAIFPYAISPEHAHEGSYEAVLNTCFDQFKANRETNANGGLKWTQYYAECRQRLHL